MSTNPVDYSAVIADLEAKKAHIESTIMALKAIAGLEGLGTAPSPSSPSGGSSGIGPNGKPAPDAFLGKSIPEAAKIYLTSQRKKLSTQELMEAMEAGGLPGSKYQTVYAILRRRENQVGDIVNIKGDWALAEWYPNYSRKPAKKAGAGGTEEEGITDVTEVEEPEENEEATA